MHFLRTDKAVNYHQLNGLFRVLRYVDKTLDSYMPKAVNNSLIEVYYTGARQNVSQLGS